MSEWRLNDMVDDVRAEMFAHARAGRSFALATIIAADGGPRPIGSQMLVDHDMSWGFLSGGCIEDDVALHGREVLADGHSQTLVYGRGSPFIDMRLPCGGRLEILVEKVAPDETALAGLETASRAREAVRWLSDGTRRLVAPVGEAAGGNWPVDRMFEPTWRLAVIGTDPFALATAQLGRTMGFETVLIAPHGSAQPPPFGLTVDRRALADAIAGLGADRWTGIVVATHDAELDDTALVAALATQAGYVGVMGARRRIPERLEKLRAHGFDEAMIKRVRMPIGLPIKALSAWEVAASIMAEIVSERRSASAAAR